jgi:hypothetical protein
MNRFTHLSLNSIRFAQGVPLLSSGVVWPKMGSAPPHVPNLWSAS